MNCNCKWLEVIMAVVVFVVAVWPGILGSVVSTWVIGVAMVLLFLHALKCKNCGTCNSGVNVAKAPARKSPKKASKKRRR